MEPFTKELFQKLGNDFLIAIEKNDEDKPLWDTRNHIPTLFNSLDEFYAWLEINYWKQNKNNND